MEGGEGFEAKFLAAEAAHMSGRPRGSCVGAPGPGDKRCRHTERVRVSLLRFDHQFFLRGAAVRPRWTRSWPLISARVWRDEILARRLCLEALHQGPAAVVNAQEPVQPTAGMPRTSLDALLGSCLTRAGRMGQALAFLVPKSSPTVRQGSTVLSEPWSPFGSHALTLVGLGRLGEGRSAVGRGTRRAGGARRLAGERNRGGLSRCASPGTGPGPHGVPASDQRRRSFPRSVVAAVSPLVRCAVRPSLGTRRRWAQGEPDVGRARCSRPSHRYAVTRWPSSRRERGPGLPVATWVRPARTSKLQPMWGRRRATSSRHDGAARIGTNGSGQSGGRRHGRSGVQGRRGLHGSPPLLRRGSCGERQRGTGHAAGRFEELGALLYAAEALGESAVHLRRGRSCSGSRGDAADGRPGSWPAARVP